MEDAPVSRYMSSPLLTIEADADAADAAQAIQEVGIKSVVITAEGCTPEGIITSADFVAMAAADRRPSETTVAEYATTDVTTIPAGANVAQAAETMREHGVTHLPVVDGDGSAVGIITASDFITIVAGEERPSPEPGK